jgi:hypothetical protein
MHAKYYNWHTVFEFLRRHFESWLVSISRNKSQLNLKTDLYLFTTENCKKTIRLNRWIYKLNWRMYHIFIGDLDTTPTNVTYVRQFQSSTSVVPLHSSVPMNLKAPTNLHCFTIVVIYYIIKMQVESATWRLHVNQRKSMKKEKNLAPLFYVKGFAQLRFNLLKLIIYSS